MRARTNLEPPYHYFTGATLLHHVAGNPDRGRFEGKLPPLLANTVDLARLLLEALVALLLKKGADPDILAGNGMTALDVAVMRQADDVATLLNRSGGRRSADL